MPLPAPVLVQPGRYGDIEFAANGTVIDPPDITRIALSALNDGVYVVDWWGICVAGTVWYRPFDVDTAAMALLCAHAQPPPVLDEPAG